MKIFQGHTSWPLDVRFFPDGLMLASTSTDQTIRIWRVDTCKCVHVLCGHTGWIRCVDISADGKLLASGSDDCSVKLWNATTGDCQRTLRGQPQRVENVAFSRDRVSLVATAGNALYIWSIESGECLRTYERRDVLDWYVSFHADKSLAVAYRTLATAESQHVVRILADSAVDNDDASVMSFIPSYERDYALSHDGSMLAYATDETSYKAHDGRIFIIDTKTFRRRHELKGRVDRVFLVAFSCDDRLLVTYDGFSAMLWCVHNGEMARKYVLQRYSFIENMSFSPKAKYLAIASGNNNVYLRRLVDVAALQTLALIMFRMGLPPYVVLHIYNCGKACVKGISIDTEDGFCHVEKITLLCTIQKRIEAIDAMRAQSATQRNYTRSRRRITIDKVSSIEYVGFA
jgi:WD40 repeat protein